MPANKPLSMILLVILLQFLSLASSRSIDAKQILIRRYDDGSDMNQQIIKDFLNVYDCPKKCSYLTEYQIREKFETYRKEWVEKMVDFVLAQLEVDEVSARQVKLNPSNYLINYETFKVLAFK